MKNSLIGKGEEMREGFPRRLWKTREHLRVKIANYKLAADHWQKLLYSGFVGDGLGFSGEACATQS